MAVNDQNMKAAQSWIAKRQDHRSWVECDDREFNGM